MVDIPERYAIIMAEDGHLDKSKEENRSDIDFGIATFLYTFMNSLPKESLIERIIKSLNYIDTLETDADKQKAYKVRVMEALNAVNESTMDLFNECYSITFSILSKDDMDFAKFKDSISHLGKITEE